MTTEIRDEMPDWYYMANAVSGEWERVVAWHERHHPDGRHYSWLEAMQATADNPPGFDTYWDQEMES